MPGFDRFCVHGLIQIELMLKDGSRDVTRSALSVISLMGAGIMYGRTLPRTHASMPNASPDNGVFKTCNPNPPWECA